MDQIRRTLLKGAGAGGAQMPLGPLDADRAVTLRRRAEEAGLYIEAIINVPQQSKDTERFTAEVKSAVAAGAKGESRHAGEHLRSARAAAGESAG